MKPLNVNHSFFRCVNSELKAYWLGYLLGDGNVHGVKVSLWSEDIDHLLKFRTAVESEHAISNHSIAFHSKEMADDLKRLGVVPAKSFAESLRLPKIPLEHNRSLLRGLFDADGWICLGTRNEARVGLSCSSRFLLEDVRDFCEKQFPNLGGRVFLKTNHWGSCWCLEWTGNKKCADLLWWLYEDSTVYLDRKKVIADQIILKRRTNRIGVYKKRGRFAAEIRLDGKKIWLGIFESEDEAARARDRYIVEHKLHFRLNFPKD